MKKLLVFYIFAIILAIFVFVLKLQTSNPEVSKVQEIQTTTKHQASSYDPCLDQGLLAGSYIFSGEVCYPTDAYIEKTNNLSEQELREGDKVEDVFIKDIFQKNGQIYITIDHIDFPECNQQTEGSVKNPSLPDCNPNGFFLANYSPVLKTYLVQDSVKIRPIKDYTSALSLTPLSPTKFMNEENSFGQKYYKTEFKDGTEIYYPPFQLIFKDNKIVYIHEIYLP